jgi:hypothetical protein
VTASYKTEEQNDRQTRIEQGGNSRVCSTNRAAVSIRVSQVFNNKQEQSCNAGKAEYVMTHDKQNSKKIEANFLSGEEYKNTFFTTEALK